VALLCFLGGAAVSVYQTEQEMLKANRAVADAVGRFLEMPVVFLHGLRTFSGTRLDLQRRFRQMDGYLLDQVMSPGQCLEFNEAGKDVISRCLGFRAPVAEAPAWFSTVYQRALGSRMTYERPVGYQGGVLGTVVVSMNTSAVTARVWSEISRMFGL